MKFFSFLFNSKKKKPDTAYTFNKEPVPKTTISQIEQIVNRMKNRELVPLKDVNLVISDYFDTKSIEGNLHKLNPTILTESVFCVESVTLVHSKDETPKTVKVVLKEHLFDLDVSVTIDIKDFHEVFKPVKLNLPT